MTRIFVFLICLLSLPINCWASDSIISESYWVQIFAASSEKSIERFLQAHASINAHMIIHENGLKKVLVGPYASYSLARASTESKNIKGAFIRKYEDSSSPERVTVTKNPEDKSAENAVLAQEYQDKKPDNQSIMDKFLELFTIESKQNDKKYTFTDFVETAEDGEITRIEITPWGNNYDVMAKEIYFSASGRKCRKLILFREDKKFPEAQTVCKSAGQNWQKVLRISDY